MKHAFAALFLFLITFYGFAQTGSVSGTVIDALTKEPLPFCNVFVNNTTIATTTDIDGNYTLSGIAPGDVEIGFSFIGYAAQQKSISIKVNSTQNLSINLVPTEQELSDVEIKASRDKVWERELKKFSIYFLGADELAASCEILNPWVIDFPEDNANSNFRAFAYQPIQIKNNALGYLVTFDLKEFQFNNQSYVIMGASRFEELEAPDIKTRNMWKANRLESYLRSPANMFRSIIIGRHNQEGFFLYGDKPGGSESRNLRSDVFAEELGKSVIKYEPDNLVTAGKNPGEYRIFLKGRIEIHYEKGFSKVNSYKDAPYPISWVEVKGNYLTVTSNGMVLNQKDMIFSGDMDKSKVGNLLPMDYTPPLSVQMQAQIIRDANSLQERIHLHTDRSYYYKGDQVFLKGYINYANPANRRTLSQVLHLEVLSEDRDVILEKKLKIENGVAVGDFFLPESLSGNQYYVRAFTQWNRNYGPDTYFIQALPVLDRSEKVIAPATGTTLPPSSIVTIQTDRSTVGKRSLVVVDIETKDANGKPLASNLSVTVTDNQFALPQAVPSRIVENLQIKEVPSHITTEKFSHAVENTLSIGGRFLNEKGKPTNTPFTIYINNFEGELDWETDKEGSFLLDEMDFYGPIDFSFLAVDKKGKGYGTFELSPKLKPPFFIPEHATMPTMAQTTSSVFRREVLEVELEEVKVEAQGKKTEKALYGNADYVIQGESLMRGGNAVDLLLGIKAFIPGMQVNSLGQVTLRGGATSVSNSLEPLVMVDGNVLPSSSAANVIRSINPNDVERVEVVTRILSIMGDMGRNGIIAIYLKRGDVRAADVLAGNPGMSSFVIEGFHPPANFFFVDYDTMEDIPELDERVTLYWNPYLFTDSMTGKVQVAFYTNDVESAKTIIVEGLSIDGQAIVGSFTIPFAK
ncbi:TonB-dependent receptor [Mongoliitalea daihaiensis]|uniref:TonB-dependent receptor n=1 Tax=Mongoliitalea daihaiensis TaxID=2782006 RepID=UPI001F3A8C51|nr:TonB-dependent receptor [Mongoliitalea daihaiensis]UJP65400.1 TonB-dependent receptor [Mongoliitalea daihaiensis]